MVYYPVVDSSQHVKSLLSQFYCVFTFNKKSFELEYKMYLQIRSLTRDEYLAEQRSVREAAREGLFPVNVLDATLQHAVMRYFDKIETS